MNNVKMENIHDIEIIHEPIGYNNPYFSENTQRHPSAPFEGDNVIINMITKPSDLSHSVFINLFVNKRQMPSVKMEMKTSASGENFWEAELGKFNAWDKVEYNFFIVTDKNQVISETYSFITGKWEKMGNPAYIVQNDGRVEIVFEPVSNSKQLPFIIFQIVGKSNLKCIFGIKHMEKILESDEKRVCDAADLGCFFKKRLSEWLENTGQFGLEAIKTVCNIFSVFLLKYSEEQKKSMIKSSINFL